MNPSNYSKACAKSTALARDLRRHLGSMVTEIAHIGGTAVPELAGRSTIDLLLITPDLYEFDQRSNTLVQMGYRSFGDGGRTGQRLLKLESTADTPDNIAELHVYEPGDRTAIHHLLLRDYLRHNKDETRRFSELKLRLADRHMTNSSTYFAGKRPRLQRLLQHATGQRWLRRSR